MVVIVEGIDRVGKTTLCGKLEQKGFWTFKDPWWKASPSPIETNPLYLHWDNTSSMYFSNGKLDTTLSVLQLLCSHNIDVVCDRLHLTEGVYGLLERCVSLKAWSCYDESLEELFHPCLVLVNPEDTQRSSVEDGRNLEPYQKQMQILFDESHISKKIVTTYKSFDATVQNIMEDNKI